MKRFLVKSSQLVFCCLLVFLVLSPAYLFLLNQDYERNEDHTLQFKYLPDQIDVAVFGSSHAGNGFQSPLYRDGTLFNFNMSLESPVMDNRLYFHFRDHLAKNAVVIIDLSCFSLYLNNTHEIDYYKRFCTFLTVAELPNAGAKLYRLFRIVDFSFNPLISYLQGKTARVEPIHTTTTAERFSPEEYAGISRQRAEEFIGYVGGQSIDPEVDAALRQMIEDCLLQGYHPVLVTTPFPRQLNELFPSSLTARFHQDCLGYAKEYGIPYLDYSQNERFADNPAYFIDADHLSSEGSDVFMTIFFRDLKEYYPDQ